MGESRSRTAYMPRFCVDIVIDDIFAVTRTRFVSTTLVDNHSSRSSAHTSTEARSSIMQGRLHHNAPCKAFTKSIRPTAIPRQCIRVRAQQSEAADAAEPTVTLKFITPEAASEPVVVECPSGEQLRACMLENKVG